MKGGPQQTGALPDGTGGQLLPQDLRSPTRAGIGRRPTAPGSITLGERGFEIPPVGESILVILKVEHPGQPHLPQLREARHAMGALLCLGQRRQQQGGQHSDNADHHEQFHQGESEPRRVGRGFGDASRGSLLRDFLDEGSGLASAMAIL